MRTSKIINGRAFTEGDMASFDDLPNETQNTVMAWIRNNIIPRKTPLRYRWSSYGIKHCLQAMTNIYITNNQFKDAMLRCGFNPVNETEVNWHYCISEKSPAFDIYRR